MVMEVPEKTRRGRPKRRWLDNTNNNLSEREREREREKERERERESFQGPMVVNAGTTL